MTTADPRTSWDLVTAAQAGDTEAFGQLWTRYQPAVAHYIASRVHNRATTEDLTSEVFLRAFRRIHTVHNLGRAVDGWFTTIARNLVADYHKSAAYTRTILPRYPISVDHFGVQDGPDVTVPRQRGEEDTAERLDRMVSRLSPGQRTVIRHRFYAGLSSAETAQRMGCEVGAVKATQHRAVRNLELAARPARTVVEFTDGTAA